MVIKLIDNTFHFSADLTEIIITDVVDYLDVSVLIDNSVILEEKYYPDRAKTVTLRDLGEIIDSYFSFPDLTGEESIYPFYPLVVTLRFLDANKVQEEKRVNVFYSRQHVAFEAQTDSVFYSRYKIKYIRRNSIDYVTLYASAQTSLKLDVIYLDNNVSSKKTISLPLNNHVGCMIAYKMNMQLIAQVSGISIANILSYDVFVTNGRSTDNIKYIVDKKEHREVHQFIYYNIFGLPESLIFTGLIEHNPTLEGNTAELTGGRLRVNPYFNDVQTINTGYLDVSKFNAVLDMITSPVQKWYDTSSVMMLVFITEIDLLHKRMGNHRVNVKISFCPAKRRYEVFNRIRFTGGIFDYTFDKTYE